MTNSVESVGQVDEFLVKVHILLLTLVVELHAVKIIYNSSVLPESILE